MTKTKKEYQNRSAYYLPLEAARTKEENCEKQKREDQKIRKAAKQQSSKAEKQKSRKAEQKSLGLYFVSPNSGGHAC